MTAITTTVSRAISMVCFSVSFTPKTSCTMFWEKAEEAAAEKEKPAKPKTTRKRKPKTEEKAEEPKTEE